MVDTAPPPHPAVSTPVEMSGSAMLLHGLIAEGVEYIFGYRGGAFMPIYDGLYDFRDRLHHIL
ncbi:MAG: hypothetical protein LH618_13255, partial [Saprospiraceae bacterium]|nr:hypothetical protein [Saprospiraceae bacterium]